MNASGWLRLAWPALLIYALALVTATHWPALDIKVSDTQSMGDVHLDKLIHALAMGLLTLLAIASRLAGRRASWGRQVILGTLAGAAFAYLDELTQQWVGRTTTMGDLLANLAGVSLAMFGGIAWGCRAQTYALRQILARMVLAIYLPALAIMAFWPGLRLAVDASADVVTNQLTYGSLMQVASLLAGAAFTGLLGLAWPTLGQSRMKLAGAALVGAAALFGLLSVNGLERVELIHGVLASLGGLVGLIVAWAMALAERSAGAQSIVMTKTPENTAGAVKPAQPSQKQFVGHAKVVSILTLVSRITGLARESVLAAVFGLSPVAAAFVFAFQIPNLFRRLFGEGALSAAIIPVYAKQLHEDPAIARRFVWLCLSLLVTILAGLTLLGELALVMALSIRDWSPDMALALQLTMLMLPYMPLVCLVAIIGAVLQVHGRFASTAAAPIVLNLVVVAFALWATRDASTPESLARSVYWVSASVLLAGVLQVAWQGVSLWKIARPTRTFTGTRPAMLSLKAIFLPMVVGLAAFQLNTFLDAVMAMAFSAGASETFRFLGVEIAYPLREASVAALNWSQRLYEFPLGIFGIAIATAIFPALAHAAANRASQGLTHFTTIFHHGLRLSVFIGLPASAGLMVVALPLSRLAYERGEFGLEDSMRVAWILLGYAPAIWAYSMNHVLTRAFYALGDSKTPLKVSLAMVAMNLLLNVILVWPMGAQGFALATAAGAMLQNVILIRVMSAYVHQPLAKEVWQSWGKSLLATLIMAGVLTPIVIWADVATMTRLDSAMLLAAMVVAGMGVYLAATWLLGCQEIRWLVKRKAGA